MLERIHTLVWGPAMLGLFLLSGLCFSIRLRFFPVLGFRRWLRATVGSLGQREAGQTKKSADAQAAGQAKGISPFQSACTALAATIGTGNIVGVATALLAGGPGAVFWMWISAFLGMATAYAETELGILHRKRGPDGAWLSGPMLYMEEGLGIPFLGIIYALFCVMASFGMGSMVQANAISENLELCFSVPPLHSGLLLAALSGTILIGGISRIAGTAERMVPFSAGLYLFTALIILWCFRKNLPSALAMILTDAFGLRPALSGAAGYGISRGLRYGIARGVFSNEAGLGTLAVLNGSAEAAAPGEQGQWAVFEVFFDTIVSCTLTALVILCTLGNELSDFSGNGAALTAVCFSKGLGYPGGYLVSLCTILFAFATILAWYYMGKQSVLYLSGKLGTDLSHLYFTGYLLAVFLGSLGPMEAIWELSDIFNGLMAVPNLAALLLLIRQVRPPRSPL